MFPFLSTPPLLQSNTLPAKRSLRALGSCEGSEDGCPLLLTAILVICWDLISHDEMFRFPQDPGDRRRAVPGGRGDKTVSRTEGNTDDSMIRGNASAEGQRTKEPKAVITGGDSFMNHPLQESGFPKEAYKEHVKDDMKSVEGKLEEQRPERGELPMTGAAEHIKPILANFKNYQFLIGENMNPDAMVALWTTGRMVSPRCDFL